MKQLEFKKVRGWGGKRRGAGRPNKTGHPGHLKREPVDFKKPLHITLRYKGGTHGLRTKQVLKQFTAAARQAANFGLHVVHFSILSNHIHFIAEAKDNTALSKGMKSLNARLGKFLVRARISKGLTGRYHMHVLKTPTEMKRALKYVLLNFAKHSQLIEHIDRFSSGLAFKNWRELVGRSYNPLLEPRIRGPAEDYNLPQPRSWLCRVGWMKALA